MMRHSIQSLARPQRALAPHGPDANGASRQFGGQPSSIRLAVDDEREESHSPREIVRLLRTLGVPFATFDPVSRCTELSPAARALLGDDADHVCRLGARLLESMPADAGAPSLGSRADSALSCVAGGRHALRAQRLPRGDPQRVGIVVMLPMRGGADGLESHRWGLSRREAEVAVLIARGSSTSDVACSLGISAHTVRRHTERIYAKVGVRTRLQLAVVLASGSSATEQCREK